MARKYVEVSQYEEKIAKLEKENADLRAKLAEGIKVAEDPAPDALQPTDDEVNSALDKMKDESDQS